MNWRLKFWRRNGEVGDILYLFLFFILFVNLIIFFYTFV